MTPSFSLRILLLSCVVLIPAATLPAEQEKLPAPQQKAVPVQKEQVAPDKKADPAEKEEPEAKTDPVSKAIQGFFRPRGNRKKPLIPNVEKMEEAKEGEEKKGETPAEEKPEEPENKRPSDHIDDRAPHNGKFGDRLRKTADMMDEGRWEEAFTRLEILLTVPTNTLIRQRNGQLILMHIEANRMLAKFPQKYLDRYKAEHGQAAAALLQQAQASRLPEDYVQVALKHFHTPAGQSAALFLATVHLDQGQFGLALRWMELLNEFDAQVTQSPMWQLRLAFVYQQAGMTKKSEAVIASLKESSPGGVWLADRPIEPKQWLASMSIDQTGHNPILEDWPMPYGTPQRIGQVSGGTPLLVPRWHQPSTNAHTIIEQLEMMTEDFLDDDVTAIPTFQPIAVDGKLLFRTFRGTQVVDAITGKTLWETRQGISAEGLVTGTAMANPDQFGGLTRRTSAPVSRYTSGRGENHTFSRFLYADQLYGTISSDGKSVFVIESHALMPSQAEGGPWGNPPTKNDAFHRDWASNQITAYDLKTGRPRWEIGGRETGELFDRSLAGYYFLCTPVPDQDSLYVIAEGNDEIRLFNLDALTGKPNWSTLLSLVDTKIDKDFGRRMWAAMPSVSQGVIVCPTTMGWLVAVDRTNHSLLWAHRYTKPTSNYQPGYNNNAYVQSTDLKDRWCAPAPIIAGHRVIYAPAEDDRLICLDLFTGSKLWEKPKNSLLYLQGVLDESLILVGGDRVLALSLDTGKEQWMRAIPDEDGPPSGRGVIADDRLHLPLRSGQLWTLELATGKVTAKLSLPEGEHALGNLLMYRGSLLSVNPFGMTAFEEQETLERELQQKLAVNPHDPDALWRKVQVLQLQGKHQAALNLLRSIPSDALSEKQRDEVRQTIVANLTTIVKNNLSKITGPNVLAGDEEMQELRSHLRTEREQRGYQRLQAARALAQQDYEAAFEILWKLSEEPTRDEFFTSHQAPVKLRLEFWLAGQFADLWKLAPAELKAQFDQRVETAAQNVLQADTADRRHFLSIWAFHPAAEPVLWQQVSAYEETKQFSQAETLLLRLSHHPEEQVAATALVRLSALLRQHGLPRDAAKYEARLKRYSNSLVLADGRKVSVILSELPADEDRNRTPHLETWGSQPLKMTRTGSGYSYGTTQIALKSFDREQVSDPFFDHLRYSISKGRFTFYDVRDDSIYWRVPLPRHPKSTQGSNVAIVAIGHKLLVLHGDVLNCLSPVDRTVLWSHRLENRRSHQSYYTPDSYSQVSELMQAEELIEMASLTNFGTRNGMLAVANASYLCLYGHHKFTVLDPQTGEVCWMREEVPYETELYGTPDLLLMADGMSSDATVLSPVDGRILTKEDATTPALTDSFKKWAYAVDSLGNSLLTVESKRRRSFLKLSKPKTTLQLFDLQTRKPRWELTLPPGSKLARLSNSRLFLVQPTGEYQLLDLELGEKLLEGTLPEEVLKSGYSHQFLEDDANLYLVAENNKRSHKRDDPSLPEITANGSILALDRQTGEVRWNKKIADQFLLITRFEDMPFLLFMGQKYERPNNQSYYYNISLEAWDKKTGKQILKAEEPSGSGYRSLHLNHQEKFIDLRNSSYRGERIRLQPGTKPVKAPRPDLTPAVGE